MNRRNFLRAAVLALTAPLVGALGLRQKPVNVGGLRGYWIVERVKVINVNWVHEDHELVSVALVVERSNKLSNLKGGPP